MLRQIEVPVGGEHVALQGTGLTPFPYDVGTHSSPM